jgi:hypothetical protein
MKVLHLFIVGFLVSCTSTQMAESDADCERSIVNAPIRIDHGVSAARVSLIAEQALRELGYKSSDTMMWVSTDKRCFIRLEWPEEERYLVVAFYTVAGDAEGAWELFSQLGKCLARQLPQWV